MNIYYIYKILNNVNNKSYIGFTNNPNNRWIDHKKVHKTDNRPLYKSMRKNGLENFSFEVIFCSTDKNYCLEEMEQYFIDFHNSLNPKFGYNLTKGGNVPVWTEEMKIKCSETHKKRFSEDLTLGRGTRHPSWGKKRTSEQKERISKGQRGKKLTKEHKQKVSLNSKSKKAVIVNELNFPSMRDASEYFKLSQSTLTDIFRGKIKNTEKHGIFSFSYLK